MSNIKLGLVSITFRQKSPQEIIRLCQENNLQGIEWGGDVHVPHGDFKTARQVRRWCEDAGVRSRLRFLLLNRTRRRNAVPERIRNSAGIRCATDPRLGWKDRCAGRR